MHTILSNAWRKTPRTYISPANQSFTFSTPKKRCPDEVFTLMKRLTVAILIGHRRSLTALEFAPWVNALSKLCQSPFGSGSTNANLSIWGHYKGSKVSVQPLQCPEDAKALHWGSCPYHIRTKRSFYFKIWPLIPVHIRILRYNADRSAGHGVK